MYISDIEQREMIYTVSQLNNTAKFLLEDTFPHVWVEGEISNFVAPASGHWYFSMKDKTAQVRCAMFRANQRKLGFTPKDGLHVLIKARVSLYEARGEYQLIAEFMEERGEGKLRQAFDALKKKLEAAGLFAEEHKKAIPLYPQQIGVITSATGAAIKDILNVLKRRYPCASVIIYPTLVQGATAAPAIVSAIETANRRNECDVLIVARGGGSLEDLWPFNEEIVAYAIYKSDIPIISGVGHEIDFTIADFVADVRAPTPSAAAELATPDKADLLRLIYRHSQQLHRHIKVKFSHLSQQLTWIQKHLAQQHPKRRLSEKIQLLDYLELTLAKHISQRINSLQTRTQDVVLSLQQLSPVTHITRLQNQLQLAHQQLVSNIQKHISLKQKTFENAVAKLDTLSPLATLRRGYAIATTSDAHVIDSADKVKIGELIEVRLHLASLKCEVKHISTIK